MQAHVLIVCIQWEKIGFPHGRQRRQCAGNAIQNNKEQYTVQSNKIAQLLAHQRSPPGRLTPPTQQKQGANQRKPLASPVAPKSGLPIVNGSNRVATEVRNVHNIDFKMVLYYYYINLEKDGKRWLTRRGPRLQSQGAGNAGKETNSQHQCQWPMSPGAQALRGRWRRCQGHCFGHTPSG